MNGSYLSGEQRDRLKRSLSAGGKLGASQVRLLNVDAYKERLGENWYKYRGIIDAIVVNAIKAHLDKDDVFVQTRGGYALLFPEKAEAEVSALTAKIAASVSALLSREREFSKPPLTCVAEVANAGEVLRQIDATEVPAPRAAVPAKAKAVDVSYAPLWHSKLERVVGCLCDPSIERPLVPVTDDKYYEASAQLMRHDIDGFMRMMGDAFKMMKAGEKGAILFSINFKSFCAAELHKEYMQALRQTPSSLMPFLTPRFVRIPPGAPGALIAAKVQLLGGVFKHVALQTPPDTDLGRFQFTGNALLVTSWKDVVRAGRGGRGAEAAVAKFCQTARGLRLSSVICGIADRGSYDGAAVAGADFLSGDFVSVASKVPVSQFKLSVAEIRTPKADAAVEVAYV